MVSEGDAELVFTQGMTVEQIEILFRILHPGLIYQLSIVYHSDNLIRRPSL